MLIWSPSATVYPSQLSHAYHSGLASGGCQPACPMCHIRCPSEVDNGTVPNVDLMSAVQDFEIYTGASIKFPKAGALATNYINASGHYTHKQRGLSFFTVGDVLERTNTAFEDVAPTGGIFSITFAWDCDLDTKKMDTACQPDISFTRVDDAKHGAGYHYRYATYSSSGGVQYRYLRKAYGLRFLILSSGTGRSFSLVAVFLTLGSTAALLGIATVAVDFIAINVLPKKDVYRHVKLRVVDEDEEEKKLLEDKGPVASCERGYGTSRPRPANSNDEPLIEDEEQQQDS